MQPSYLEVPLSERSLSRREQKQAPLSDSIKESGTSRKASLSYNSGTRKEESIQNSPFSFERASHMVKVRQMEVDELTFIEFDQNMSSNESSIEVTFIMINRVIPASQEQTQEKQEIDITKETDSSFDTDKFQPKCLIQIRVEAQPGFSLQGATIKMLLSNFH